MRGFFQEGLTLAVGSASTTLRRGRGHIDGYRHIGFGRGITAGRRGRLITARTRRTVVAAYRAGGAVIATYCVRLRVIVLLRLLLAEGASPLLGELAENLKDLGEHLLDAERADRTGTIGRRKGSDPWIELCERGLGLKSLSIEATDHCHCVCYLRTR